jgi:tetratricopeptide (TPR) repeat protein
MESAATSAIIPRLRTCILVIIGFFIAVFATFGSSLSNRFVTWDDSGLIVDNPNIRSINATTLKAVFTSYDPELYIPLTFVSYQIDYKIGGANPFIVHLHNLFLHTCNAILIAWLLYLLLGNGWIAVVLGLLFALHPINVEAAVWASARKDVLTTFYFLASVITYLLWRNGEKRWMYLLSIVLFLFALLSKVVVATLPIVLLLLDGLMERRMTRRAWLEKIPFFTLSIIFGVVALFGKAENLVSSTVIQKILLAARSALFYLPKFVAPTALSPIYPFNGVIMASAPAFFVPTVLVVILITAAAYFWQRARSISFTILFYFVTLLPTFFNLTKGGNVYLASDRYAYIPMIGILYLLGVALDRWLSDAETVRSMRKRSIIIASSAISVLLVLSVASAKQATAWANSETLYRSVLANYPDAQPAHNNLGMELLGSSRTDAAITEFKLALAIQNDPRIMANLGAAYVQKGMLTEALVVYRQAIELAPDLPAPYYGLGNILRRQGKLQDAVSEYKRALAVDAKYVNALNNLGAVYVELKQWDDAISTLEQSIAIKPDFPEAYYNLAGAYMQEKKWARSEELFRKALTFSPHDADALASLATVLYEQGKTEEAVPILHNAFVIDPANPQMLTLLARLKKAGVVQ